MRFAIAYCGACALSVALVVGAVALLYWHDVPGQP